MFDTELLTERELQIHRCASSKDAFDLILWDRSGAVFELLSEICVLRTTNNHFVQFVVPKLVKFHKLLVEAQACLDPTTNVSLIEDITQLVKEVPMEHWESQKQYLTRMVAENNELLHRLLRGQHDMSTVLANLQSVDSRLAAAINESIADQQAATQEMKDLAQKIADLTAAGQINPAAVQSAVDDLQTKAQALEDSNAALKSALTSQTTPPTVPADGSTPTTGDTGTTAPPDLGSTGNETGSDGSAPTDANAQHPSNADIGATSLDTAQVTDESIGSKSST